MRPIIFLGVFLCGIIAGTERARAEDIVPYPRQLVKTAMVMEWSFATGDSGWEAGHDCSAAVRDGVLRIQSTGDDPYLFGPAIHVKGPVTARLRMKCAAGGNGQIFWTTAEGGGFNEGHSQHFQLIRDNQWHDYSVRLNDDAEFRGLRLDPCEAPGSVEVQSFQLLQETLHPLEVRSVQTDGANVTVRLKNYASERVSFTMGGRKFSLEGGATENFTETAPGTGPFRTHDLAIESPGLPTLRRVVSIIDSSRTMDWASLRSGEVVLRAARDGSGAWIELGGKRVGALAPLVNFDGETPKLKLTHDGDFLAWSGDGVTVKISMRGDAISMEAASDRPCEGPVLRAFGELEQGLFAGLEYLAKGEHSSSTLDIETEEHIRYAPDPMKVPMPLMAFVTDRATTALTWRDMTLQPVFATPNFLDGPTGHRAALRGRKIECTLEVRPRAAIEEAIVRAAREGGLPPLPAPPRSEEAELKLCLTTLSGPPLRTEKGWGHCAEKSWAREPYADQASTLWRLSGEVPTLPRVTPGGSHIVNDAIYFVSGRAEEWLQMRKSGAQGIIGQQKADGSFRYEGKYARGHFEDTASGYCASYAMQLLDHARLTGDPASLEAGVKALEYMKHFNDPRGAQTWECPLHTPDILASAFLVHAYVRGYELTGKAEYLERARQWAISGVPFVYQWSSKPVMAYATIAVFGATGWRAPNWMGLPVQWCGYDYAYALAMLAPYDHALDWKKIAKGILITAEQMQYPDGRFAGCEPDSFVLSAQRRNGPAINPCAIVSLLLTLDGKLDSLAVAAEGGRRVVAPFPVEIRGGRAHVHGRAGVAYQAVVDGKRVVSVESKGEDEIELN
jgi:hypothetical protein